MKQVYTIILSVLLSSTYALANVQTPQRLGVTDESILAKVQECEETRNSNYPVHYCACTHAHQKLAGLPLDIAVSDSLWFKGSVSTFGTGVTAYIYGETGVHIDLYLNCRAKGPISAGTFVGSVDVEPNNIWDIDEATIAAKLKEAGISSAVYMCIYPLEEGSEARLFCNPYNVGPHSTCDDVLPVVPGMTFVSSHEDDVYVLRPQDVPAEGTLLVNWFKHSGAGCTLTIKRGSCDGPELAQVDLSSVYEISREWLNLGEELYFQLSHKAGTAGRIRVDVKNPAPTGCDNLVAPKTDARLVLEKGMLYIERDGVRYSLTGSRL